MELQENREKKSGKKKKKRLRESVVDSTKKKRSRPQQSRDWCLTLYLPYEKTPIVEEFARKHAKYFIGQAEYGKKSGKYHLQCFMQLQEEKISN